jgi:hypothetical protein
MKILFKKYRWEWEWGTSKKAMKLDRLMSSHGKELNVPG